MAVPNITDLKAYADFASWSDAQLTLALSGEQTAQANRITQPSTGAWPEDMLEALYRSVQRNLWMRGLPGGYQTALSEGGGYAVQVSKYDREIQRLEAPYRRWRIS